jgi:hypothetical protein
VREAHRASTGRLGLVVRVVCEQETVMESRVRFLITAPSTSVCGLQSGPKKPSWVVHTSLACPTLAVSNLAA